MIEGHLDRVRRRRNRFVTRELELLNQIFVRDLSEPLTLLRIEVDVIDVERGRDNARRIHGIQNERIVCPNEILKLIEFERDAHFVVLESDQGQGETGMPIKPELKGNEQRVLRTAAALLGGRVGIASCAITGTASIGTDRRNQIREFRHIAHHLRISRLLSGRSRELVPDMEPIAIVFVDLLATDFNVDVVDDVVSDPVEPAELIA